MLNTSYEMNLNTSVTRMEITLDFDVNINLDLDILKRQLNGMAAVEDAIESMSILNMDYSKELRIHFKHEETYAMLTVIENLKSALYESITNYDFLSPDIIFIA